MSENTKLSMINDAKGLAKFFAVDIVIKIFGHVIWEYHFPLES